MDGHAPQDDAVALDAAKVALGTDHIERIDVASSRSPHLTGVIGFSIPDGRDVMRMGVIQHRLRDGVPLGQLDPTTQLVVVMLSTLAVVVREAPEWWYRIDREPQTKRITHKTPAPEAIHDLDLLWSIYERYVAFRDSFPYPAPSAGDRQPPA